MKRFDPISFVGGVTAIAVAVAFAVGEFDDLASQARVLWPAVLLAAGLALLLDGLRRDRSDGPDERSR